MNWVSPIRELFNDGKVSLLWLLSLLLFGTLSLTSCKWSRPDLTQKAVVKVNSSQFLAVDFARQLAEELRPFDSLAVNNKKILNFVKDRIIQGFIISAINKEWAQAHNVFVSKEELEKHIRNIQGHYPDDLSFRESLAKEKLNIALWEKKIKDSLLQKKIQRLRAQSLSQPTEEELREFYRNNLVRFSQGPRVKIQQITLSTLHHAKVVLKALTEEGADPEKMAREFSVTPEGQNGGYLGWIEQGTSSIFEQAFDLRVYEWSSVVKSPFGYHVFRVLEKKRKNTLTFDEVRVEIQRILLEKKEQDSFLKWLQKQVASAQIYKDLTLIARIVPKTKGK